MSKISTPQAAAVADYISKWLLDYAKNAKVNGFVVGVSGGIDSAVTSTLCARTGLPVYCLEMPIHQHESQVNRAAEHIDALIQKYPNVSRQLVDLTPVFESFKSAVTQTDDQATVDLSLANTRARLRMTSLYYYAGLTHSLVAGTGNKVEDFGVGFYTKYGDGGVDVSPIADLYKSEVYALGRVLGVPNSILEAAPTDGLFGDSRTDEDQLGASYDELEWAMETSGSAHDPSTFTERQATVFAIYKRLNNANQHKMNPIPVCEIPAHFKK
ncbi:NAD(+) synthase [Flavobacterium aurantiibacter]|uniref:NH(3)-dependent NAD(+) synthetase n=1 Tax=Flavobacterium aurantiibacter TaxID=2023067 RepID=A0A255ZUW2_9FLAO|nr:NAD(+) synthase [Flavobacterium aurantiibacter]OYQ45273.1 NAD(+) synthase [Flavobacterium aurantiibacter]